MIFISFAVSCNKMIITTLTPISSKTTSLLFLAPAFSQFEEKYHFDKDFINFLKSKCRYSVTCFQVHGTIELCALTLIGVEMGLKTRWIGWKTFFKHKRTFIKVRIRIFINKFLNKVISLLRNKAL